MYVAGALCDLSALTLYRRCMAYASRHKLLTVYGTSWSPISEEWQFTMRIKPNGTDTVSQAQADAIYALASTLFNDVGFSMKSVHSFLGVKLAPIGIDGKYVPGEIAYFHEGTAVPGKGTGGDPWPGQCALAITTRTSIPRGRASRGRFYLPGMQGTIGADGRLASGRPATILAPLKTFCDGVNAAANVGHITVMSQTGEFATVTALECGSVVDTIRRRRRQLVEVRVQTALA